MFISSWEKSERMNTETNIPLRYTFIGAGNDRIIVTTDVKLSVATLIIDCMAGVLHDKTTKQNFEITFDGYFNPNYFVLNHIVYKY